MLLPDEFETEGFEVRAARDAEISHALTLLLQRTPADERAATVAALHAALADGSFHREQLLIACAEERLLGAAAVQLVPGATAVVWPPGVVDEAPPAAAGRLLGETHRRAAARGALLAQSLLPVEELPALEAMRAAGYADHGVIQYLLALFEPPEADDEPAEPLHFLPFQPNWEHRLLHVLEQTYLQSLDFPSLGNPRPLDLVLLGYRHTGCYKPKNWFLVTHGGRDIGCLLLTEHAGGSWELVYMGLVPSARGRGWGRRMLRFALRHSAARGGNCMLLAVDERNEPARRGYAAQGFRLLTRKRLLARLLP